MKPEHERLCKWLDTSLLSTIPVDALCHEAAAAIRELGAEVERLKKQVDGWSRMMAEALNSGDGSYKP